MKKKDIKIGFTGTQVGMTDRQKGKVKDYITKLKLNNIITEAHHGDCIGADHHFHDICVSKRINIYIHPPKNPSKRAFCKSNNIFPEKEYLDRNKDIVDASDILIATPKEYQEELRSGTWSTIRYARKLHKKIIIVHLNGELKVESFKISKEGV